MVEHDVRGGRRILAVALFVLVFAALQGAWSALRGGAVERWLIQDLTVHSSVRLIGVLTPQAGASAQGFTIRSPGGGLAIRNGCEGMELLFLLLAGLIAYPFSARARVLGLVAGAVLVFVLNQVRLLALFYSARGGGALFEQVHGLIAPLVVVAVLLLGFSMLIRWDRLQGEAGHA